MSDTAEKPDFQKSLEALKEEEKKLRATVSLETENRLEALKKETEFGRLLTDAKSKAAEYLKLRTDEDDENNPVDIEEEVIKQILVDIMGSEDQVSSLMAELGFEVREGEEFEDLDTDDNILDADEFVDTALETEEENTTAKRSIRPTLSHNLTSFLQRVDNISEKVENALQQEEAQEGTGIDHLKRALDQEIRKQLQEWVQSNMKAVEEYNRENGDDAFYEALPHLRGKVGANKIGDGLESIEDFFTGVAGFKRMHNHEILTYVIPPGSQLEVDLTKELFSKGGNLDFDDNERINDAIEVALDEAIKEDVTILHAISKNFFKLDISDQSPNREDHLEIMVKHLQTVSAGYKGTKRESDYEAHVMEMGEGAMDFSEWKETQDIGPWEEVKAWLKSIFNGGSPLDWDNWFVDRPEEEIDGKKLTEHKGTLKEVKGVGSVEGQGSDEEKANPLSQEIKDMKFGNLEIDMGPDDDSDRNLEAVINKVATTPQASLPENQQLLKKYLGNENVKNFLSQLGKDGVEGQTGNSDILHTGELPISLLKVIHENDIELEIFENKGENKVSKNISTRIGIIPAPGSAPLLVGSGDLVVQMSDETKMDFDTFEQLEAILRIKYNITN